MVNKEYEDYWGDDVEQEKVATAKKVHPKAPLKQEVEEEAELEEETDEDSEVDPEETEEESEEESEEEAEEEVEEVEEQPRVKKKPGPAPRLILKKPQPKAPEVRVIHQPAQPEAYFLDIDGERISLDELPIKTFLELREIKKLLKR